MPDALRDPQCFKRPRIGRRPHGTGAGALAWGRWHGGPPGPRAIFATLSELERGVSRTRVSVCLSTPRVTDPNPGMTEDDWIDLCRAHMPRLYRSVSRRVGADRALAEDLTQEAWLRAIDTWRREGVANDPDAWLLTVASNLLRNHFRRLPMRGDIALDARPAEDPAEDADDEAESTARSERAARVQSGLARLRPEQAELLAERHLDGRPLSELAARRGLTERAVEGRLRRARAALARRLGDDALLDPSTSI